MASDTYGYQPFLTMPDGFPAARSLGIYDVYDLERYTLTIASDRCPAPGLFEPDSIRNYGRMVHALGNYWREKFKFLDFMTASVITTKLSTMCSRDARFFALAPHVTELTGRICLAKSCPVIPLCCAVYGYLDGLAWQEYQRTKAVAGVCLGSNFAVCGALPEPAFMPVVSDSNGISHVIDRSKALDDIYAFLEMTFGADVAKQHANCLLEQVRHHSVNLYIQAAEYALKKELLIANTTFRWGITLLDGGASFLLQLLGDSLTPENSRYWSLPHYKSGETQHALTKRPLYNWLEATNWGSTCHPPKIPPYVVNQVQEEAKQLYKQLTGLQSCW